MSIPLADVTSAIANHPFDLNGNGVFDIGDVIIFGSVIGGIVGALWASLKGLVWLIQKFSGRPSEESSRQQFVQVMMQLSQTLASMPLKQSEACGVQHAALTEKIDQNTEGIRELVGALRDQIHADELRFQNMNMQLQLISKNQESFAFTLERLAEKVRS